MCFFFNDTATTEIYTLSLHDALPIYRGGLAVSQARTSRACARHDRDPAAEPSAHGAITSPSVDLGSRPDRKSTRLNSSHGYISYAVFCLKKKKEHPRRRLLPRPWTLD